MASERERRAAALFQEAIALAPDARLEFARERCGCDAALRHELESLLQADGSANQFLRSPWPGVLTQAPSSNPEKLPAGRRVGRYSLGRLIAAGGMGAVYEATQDAPSRIVALKMMRSGVVSPSALRRFEFESQFLARLRHPSIAQIFEAGTHHDGDETIPYFAMELIPGARPITDFARENRLAVRERLRLFLDACAAVHHGHQNGVIHRDLKPANALVDSSGCVKIIDFGVARAIDSDVACATMQTDPGVLVGTLQYMSPEQVHANGENVDVRSDVYSLGVLLYELVCDRLPYDVGAKGVADAARLIRDASPERPSSTSRGLRGDLETIVLKALEKDPARRYQSAAELAADLSRFLAGQPISARPPSVTYQLRSFARRNKVLVAGVATTFASLVVGLVVVSLMAVRLQRESVRKAENIAFLESLLVSAAAYPVPNDARRYGANVLWADVIDDAMVRLDANPLADRAAEATIRHHVGFVYFWMNRFDLALANLSSAHAMRTELLGAENLDTLESAIGLAYCKIFQFDSDEAVRLAASTAASFRRLEGPASPHTISAMHALMLAQLYAGHSEDLTATAREIDVITDSHPELRPLAVDHKALLANVLLNTPGRLDDAERIARDAIAQSEGRSDITQGYARIVLGWLHEARGDLTSAEAEVRAGIALWDGRSRTTQLEFTVTLGRIVGKQAGRLAEGLAIVRAAVESARLQHGPHHPFTVHVEASAADQFVSAEQFAEAERYCQSALASVEIQKHVPVQEHARTALVLGHSLRAQRKFEEAEVALRSALASADRFSTEQWRRHRFKSKSWFWTELGLNSVALGRDSEADACFARARAEILDSMEPGTATFLLHSILRRPNAAEFEPVARRLLELRLADPWTLPSETADADLKLARILTVGGAFSEAEACYRDGLARLGAPADSSGTLAVALTTNLATFLEARGRAPEAEFELRARIEVCRASKGDRDPATAGLQGKLAWLLVTEQRPAEAEPPARAAIDAYRSAEPLNEAALIGALDTLGVALRDVGRLDDAAAIFDEIRERWSSTHDASVPLRPSYALHVGECFVRMGRFSEAEPLLMTVFERAKAEVRDATVCEGAGAALIDLYTQTGRPNEAAALRAAMETRRTSH